ncbi:mitochondrial import receptor subunit TOM7 homolog [Microtus oregoni]|uniref:mitochondrial import receptor subunit TOM7 homolog n=1 Tax=Microtus oregoni TaxID=111838 RepID=UPI001BB279B5|nr:mitochondrial import receptor subunit TOM7 homolog [Microtus oregoni]XP_041495644.1 mitochondrial import receptor subunit TOM7 homolog [Microtus oregoni]
MLPTGSARLALASAPYAFLAPGLKLSMYNTSCSVVATVKLSKEAKQRLQQLFKGDFIPLVIYLAFTRGADPGMPEPSVLSLLWG